MSKKRPYKYKPRKLKTREVGNSRCEVVRGPRGGKLQLCVEAKSYGYAGWLVAPSGAKLPVSVGRARSLKSAMSAARQFMRRLKQRSGR